MSPWYWSAAVTIYAGCRAMGGQVHEGGSGDHREVVVGVVEELDEDPGELVRQPAGH
jgi:hypothetical protein